MASCHSLFALSSRHSLFNAFSLLPPRSFPQEVSSTAACDPLFDGASPSPARSRSFRGTVDGFRPHPYSPIFPSIVHHLPLPWLLQHLLPPSSTKLPQGEASTPTCDPLFDRASPSPTHPRSFPEKLPPTAVDQTVSVPDLVDSFQPHPCSPIFPIYSASSPSPPVIAFISVSSPMVSCKRRFSLAALPRVR